MHHATTSAASVPDEEEDDEADEEMILVSCFMCCYESSQDFFSLVKCVSSRMQEAKCIDLIYLFEIHQVLVYVQNGYVRLLFFSLFLVAKYSICFFF